MLAIEILRRSLAEKYYLNNTFIIMAIIIDGKKIAQEILEDIKNELSTIKFKKGLRLGIILVGDNDASESFIKQKKKVANFLGIRMKIFNFPKNITTRKLRKEIQKIKKMRLNGLIIQLPLPGHINKQYILNSIPPELDVDCLAENSVKKLYANNYKILPPTIEGIFLILKHSGINDPRNDLKGKTVVIVGTGDLIGKPLAVIMINNGATICVCNEYTKDLKEKTLLGDILVSGTGKAKLINGDMIKEGAIVIDAGFSIKDGKIVGDIEKESVSKKASFVSPVPGGLGPITTALLFKNLLKKYKLNKI